MASDGGEGKVDPNQADTEELELEGIDSQAEMQVTALMALAEMDLAAAAAYDIGARCFDEAEQEQVSTQLRAFGQDHLRHVENLDRLVQAMGSDPVAREGAEESVLARLAEAAEALGPRMALFAMISNEQLTTGTYGSILEQDWPDEIRSVLERNFQDERRHLQWLEQQRDRLAAEGRPSEART